MINRPGLLLRLTIVIYDGLLLAGVLFAAYTVIFALSLLLPEPITSSAWLKHLQFAMLVLLSFLFYGWFWVNGGQTLGMRAWHLYLIKEDGKFISWKQAAIRYCSAFLSWICIGLGFAFILLNRDKKTWHDILSKSSIVRHKATTKKNDKQAT